MDRDQISALSDRLVDLWNARDADGIAELYAAEATVRDAPNADGAAHGREAIFARTRMILDGFSDAKLELLTRLIDGDRVATEWRFTGTHDGEFLGVPATGQPTENLGASVSQVDAEGKIVSESAYWDLANFLRQTGVLPAAGADTVSA
jgi:steroid delta-isomerase-like uncharacterized protein